MALSLTSNQITTANKPLLTNHFVFHNHSIAI